MCLPRYGDGQIPESVMQIMTSLDIDAEDLTDLHTGNYQGGRIGETDDDRVRQKINHDTQSEKPQNQLNPAGNQSQEGSIHNCLFSI